MSAFQKRLGSFLIGLYVWVLTISFGMTLLDILYARLVPEANSAFSKVSDFLLLVSLVTFLLAIAAIAFSMQSKTARNYLVTSQLISLLAFLMPAFFSLLGLNTPGLSIGPWLRITSGGTASIVAFIGMVHFNRQN